MQRRILMTALSLSVLLMALPATARRRAPAKPQVKAQQGSKASRSDEEAASEITGEMEKKDIGKSLAERIQAVTQQAFVRSGRFIIGPYFGMSVNDPFYQSFPVGLNVGIYALDSLYFGLNAEYMTYNMVTTTVRVLGREHSRPDYYRPHYFGHVVAAWSPFYGKISLLAENVVHFDMHILAGAGVGAQQSGTPRASDPPMSVSAIAGIGGHLFVNQWSAIRWEISDRIISGARYIGPIPGKEEMTLQHFIFLSAGYDFFFP